jgi:hypothetical protein
VGKERRAQCIVWCSSLHILVRSALHVHRGKEVTFGIAYTNDPNADEEEDSAVDVVRNSSKLGPLSVSCRCTFVCGALGSGNATSTGACDALPLLNVVAIACGGYKSRRW